MPPAPGFRRPRGHIVAWWLAGGAAAALLTIATVAWQAANRQRRDGEGALRQAAADAAARMLASILEHDGRELALPFRGDTVPAWPEASPPIRYEWFEVPGDPSDWIFGPWPRQESDAAAVFRSAMTLHREGKTAEARNLLTGPGGLLDKYDPLTPNRTYQPSGGRARKPPPGVTDAGLPAGPLILRHLVETSPHDATRRTYAMDLLQAAWINPSVLTQSFVEEAAVVLTENGTPEETQAVAKARAAAETMEKLRRALKEHRQEVFARKPWIGREWNLTYYGTVTTGTKINFAVWDTFLVAWSLPALAEWLSGRGIGAPVPGLPDGWIFKARRDGIDVPGPAPEGTVMAEKESGRWSLAVVARNPSRAFATLDDQLARQRWLIAGATAFMAAALGGFLSVLARQRRLNAMMSNFVASVSHELRAPVASMGLLAERLGDGRISGEEEQARYHKLICGESRRISATIENVLAFSRRERGRRLYEHELADLTALLRDTADIVRPLAEERHVLISVKLPENGVERELDPVAIRQAVLNLLDNALKFSPPGGTIHLELREENGDALIAVRDEGPGIPMKERSRIFEPFYRIGSELRRETPGIGIGLSIVRDAALAHGGEVHVNGAAEKGAEFLLRLRGGNLQPPS